MQSVIREISAGIAIVAVLIGTGFSIIGIIGFLRLPDIYTRLHATGKVSTFGVVLLFIAAAVFIPLGWGKAIFLIALVLISGPVVSHAIASAAYRIGLPMQDVVCDDLAHEIGDS
jgi:multicomponent Na+:H+ antiporter subunit G